MITFAVLRSISEPFNAGSRVEVKLTFDPLHTAEGEIYWRVPASEASSYVVGDTFSVSIQRV